MLTTSWRPSSVAINKGEAPHLVDLNVNTEYQNKYNKIVEVVTSTGFFIFKSIFYSQE